MMNGQEKSRNPACGKSRKKNIKIKDGKISFPFFMPDATRGFVKLLSREDLLRTGVGPLVVNTYHLYLHPGASLIKKAGGIHKFMNWEAPILSDSGGYQVFSLIHKNPRAGKITDNEIIFKSPLDGSKHIFTPEKSIRVQFELGVDMMVVLDDCPPNNYPYEKIENSVRRTIQWAKRCKREFENQIKKRKIKKEERPLIFGVIQGGSHKNLRKFCADELVKIGFDGLGFGARHHDEKGNLMEDLLKFTADCIPENYLKFALGVGTPEDIVRCVRMGWEMFDCVIPTREGRHGRLFIFHEQPELPVSGFSAKSGSAAGGQFPNKPPNKSRNTKSKIQNFFYDTININNEKYKDDFNPVDKKCNCELCQNHSRAYLRYLFTAKDPLGMRLAAIHNLKFYLDLMDKLKSIGSV